MPRILSVIAEKGFRDEEFAIPLEMFRSAGHRVEVASTSAAVAEGKLGMRVTPDLCIEEALPDLYDAIVVTGGPSTPTYIWPNRHLQAALTKVHGKGGIVAAICLAPAVLARAGLLKGKRVTTFRTPDSLEELRAAGSLLRDDHVVVDGRIVTADGPAAARPFAEAVLRLLG